MPVGLARVDVLSIRVIGVAGVDGSTAPAPAFASEAPGRLATDATIGASSIDPQLPHSGHRPTHLGTVHWHDEQRKLVLSLATRPA